VTNIETFNLDSRQLTRIEAVHRGFLYQHLYAVACLFQAAIAGVTHVVVENDEDVELVLPDKRIYAQIKTRGSHLIFSDIDGAIARFDSIRTEHVEGRRSGASQFAVVSNSAPGPELCERLKSSAWPSDVALLCPGFATTDKALPTPWSSVSDGFDACRAAAETLPFSILAPETLVWKLAGRIMAAAAGIEPNPNHTFAIQNLPTLFEQLIIQLQDFPAPPLRYRPQDKEPPLVTTHRVRLVIGFSGAAKPHGFLRRPCTQAIGWHTTTWRTFPGLLWPAQSLASSPHAYSGPVAAHSERSFCRVRPEQRSSLQSGATLRTAISRRP